jgi:hypothetical protein
LTLLTAQENREKSGKEFDEWIHTREPAFLDRHFIPRDEELWKPEAFRQFVEERARLVRDRLFRVLGSEKS